MRWSPASNLLRYTILCPFVQKYPLSEFEILEPSSPALKLVDLRSFTKSLQGSRKVDRKTRSRVQVCEVAREGLPLCYSP
jgi:hypothetical protein